MTIYRTDKTDLKILSMLQQNARLTIKEMAQELNLSTTPVFERIKRMEKGGLIKKYVAIIDPRLLGKTLHAFIHISINEHSKKGLEAFVEQIIELPEVLECHHISGVFDFILKTIFDDMEAYNQFILNDLSVVPNIGRVETRFSLSVRKHTTAIPVNSSQK